MSKAVSELQWNGDELWRGCMLAAIAHAIMVAHYPELSNEHSWDGLNYSVQDSSGSRGTITFGTKYIVGAIRDDSSKRIVTKKEAIDYLDEAPYEVVELAKNEALQYLLEDIDGNVQPIITLSFWGTTDSIYSSDSEEVLYEHGISLLEFQLMDIEEALESWKDYYEMSSSQYELLVLLYNRKVKNSQGKIFLTKEEIKKIGNAEQEGLDESIISFNEIGIEWT